MEIRVFHVTSRRHYIVEGDKVYGDKNGDGKICRADLINVPEREILVEAADHFLTFHDPRVPGIAGPDGSVINCGLLNRVEKLDFEGTSGTWAARPLVQEHLAFFDPRGYGKIGLGDNYRSWRDLGFGVFKSLIQTVGSALVFGWRNAGTIEVARVPRPRGSTGIYDAAGNFDEARWRDFMKAWEEAAEQGALTIPRARQVMSEQARLGRIPGRQFESLYSLCARLNGSATIRLEQIGWLYDGSLLWRAAQALGTRPSVTQPNGKPVVGKPKG